MLTLLLMAAASAPARAQADSSYQVEITATSSPMVNFFRLPRVPGSTSTVCLGYGMTGRALWHPGRLLSIGLVSGYYILAVDEIPVLSSASNATYAARLAAVPLQFAITMRKQGLEIGLELGPYLMLTTISGGRSAPAHASRLELGMTIFGSYLFPLSDDFQCGPELRVVDLRYRGIVCVMPSFSVRMISLRY